MSLLLPFTQAWLPEPEPEFRPGTARISWNNGHLNLLAEMVDDEVMTTTTANQQRLWEMGDVVELFFQQVGESGYHEHQITPNGFTLSLFYPDILSIAEVRGGRRCLEEFLSESPLRAIAAKNSEGWRAELCVGLPGNPGDQILVSCCRYDYGSGRSPIISSISPHPVRDFHRPQDWREMVLVGD